MKNVVKILAVLLFALILFSLSACGSKNANSKTNLNLSASEIKKEVTTPDTNMADINVSGESSTDNNNEVQIEKLTDEENTYSSDNSKSDSISDTDSQMNKKSDKNNLPENYSGESEGKQEIVNDTSDTSEENVTCIVLPEIDI